MNILSPILPRSIFSSETFCPSCIYKFPSAIIDHGLINQVDAMSQPLSPAALQDPAVLQLPALSAPPGVIPNFTNPEDIGPRLIVSGAILLTFVIIALASRAYTKLCIIRKISLDDLTISLAAMCAIASYTLCVYGNGNIWTILSHTD